MRREWLMRRGVADEKGSGLGLTDIRIKLKVSR